MLPKLKLFHSNLLINDPFEINSSETVGAGNNLISLKDSYCNFLKSVFNFCFLEAFWFFLLDCFYVLGRAIALIWNVENYQWIHFYNLWKSQLLYNLSGSHTKSLLDFWNSFISKKNSFSKIQFSKNSIPKNSFLKKFNSQKFISSKILQLLWKMFMMPIMNNDTYVMNYLKKKVLTTYFGSVLNIILTTQVSKDTNNCG